MTRKRPTQTHNLESLTVRNSKRPQHAAASTRTTSKFLSERAKEWVEAERRFYETNNDSGYSPLIANEGSVIVPELDHLVAAANEFARRFPFRTVDDEDQFVERETSSESPFLLVANNVKDSWHVSDKFLKSDHPIVRFMLVPGDTNDSSILFIRCMAGYKHGRLDCTFTRDVDGWITANTLRSVLIRIDGGGGEYDKAYTPYVPDRLAPQLDADERLDGAPYARLVVEVEYAHRTVRALRTTGLNAMNYDYTRLFLCARIWVKNADADFGAAAVLWAKSDAGTISVVKAVDFGTRELNESAKKYYTLKGRSPLQDIHQ